MDLGRADLLDNPDYRTREDRKRNRIALRGELESVLLRRPAATWVGELNARGVPTGPVLSVAEALDDPKVFGRGRIETRTTGEEDLKLAGSPVMINGARPAPQGGPP
jgi:formyl-CoA transferase